MTQRQINIRLPLSTVEVLETAAYLAEVSSVPEYVRLLIEADVERARANPRVQAVLRSRAEERAAREGKLSAIDERRPGRTS